MLLPTEGDVMTNPTEIADRYVAMWNEPDPDRRRTAIAELWSEDAVHQLQPPQDMRDAAAAPGIGLTARLEARGHAQLERRATSAYERFIGPGEYVFRRRDDAERLADVVKFHWEMVAADSGEVAAVGLEFLVLAPDGRIRTDYQFIER
jgi:hypothetical protein